MYGNEVEIQRSIPLSHDESRVYNVCVFLSGQTAPGDGDGAFASNPFQGDREQRRRGGGDQTVLQQEGKEVYFTHIHAFQYCYLSPQVLQLFHNCDLMCGRSRCKMCATGHRNVKTKHRNSDRESERNRTKDK